MSAAGGVAWAVWCREFGFIDRGYTALRSNNVTLNCLYSDPESAQYFADSGIVVICGKDVGVTDMVVRKVDVTMAVES